MTGSPVFPFFSLLLWSKTNYRLVIVGGRLNDLKPHERLKTEHYATTCLPGRRVPDGKSTACLKVKERGSIWAKMDMIQWTDTVECDATGGSLEDYRGTQQEKGTMLPR